MSFSGHGTRYGGMNYGGMNYGGMNYGGMGRSINHRGLYHGGLNHRGLHHGMGYDRIIRPISYGGHDLYSPCSCYYYETDNDCAQRRFYNGCLF
jgi:hypothetical protein